MKRFEDLVAAALNETAQVQTATQAITRGQQAVAEAEARKARAQAELKAADTVEGHRNARQVLATSEDAIAEAKIELRIAEKNLPRARREAHDAIAAIVNAEYARRLPAFRVALETFERAVAELAEVERIAARFDLPSSGSYGVGRRALADVDMALPIVERLKQWKRWLAARLAA